MEHTVTKESINRKQREEKRLQDIAESANKSSQNVAQPSSSKCLPHMLFKSRCGKINRVQMAKELMYSRISNLPSEPPSSPKIIKPWPASRVGNVKLDHSVQMEMNKSCDRIVGLYSVVGCLSQRIQLMNVKEAKRENENSRLSVEIQGNCNNAIHLRNPSSLELANKVTCMCWADQVLYPDDLCILYSVMSYVKSDTPNFVALHSLYSSGGGMRVNPVFPIGNKFIWSCGWDRYSNRLSVGSEKCALVMDTISRKMWEFSTDSSDVFSQVFSGKVCRVTLWI